MVTLYEDFHKRSDYSKPLTELKKENSLEKLTEKILNHKKIDRTTNLIQELEKLKENQHGLI